MAEQGVPTDSPGSPEAEYPADPAAVSPAGPGAGSSASIGDIIAWQEEVFAARQPESRQLAGRARLALAGGVTSSWQTTRPQPVWLSHGKGSKIYDVDGNEYVDLHGGYGAALAGHGHPAIVEAVRSQAALGTHFAQPTPAAILVAEELARRFGLPLWRFANSGTEATMDAVHLMRAITGRDLIIKVEGCYHGHHDSVQVSVCPEAEEVGPPHKPAQVRSSTGIPQAIVDLTLVVSFNDLEGVARLLDEHVGRIAGMIIEPIMMNAGIILSVRAGLPDELLPDRAAICEMFGDPYRQNFLPSADNDHFHIRALLRIPLIGKHPDMLYCIWVKVDGGTASYARAVWNDDSRYRKLTFTGRLANGVAPWGMLGAEVTAAVRDVGQLPHIESSPDRTLTRVLTEPQPYETAVPDPATARR
jgi:hypothetical protein